LEYALVGGFNFAFAMIVAPLVTVLTHRFGSFVTMPIGIAIQTSGYTAAGFVDSIGQLMITQGILVGVGIGFIYVPSLPILSQWFEARRSLLDLGSAELFSPGRPEPSLMLSGCSGLCAPQA
jgi:MFS family permease